jgi:hypothetical protein
MGLSGEADLRAEPPAAGLERAATLVLPKRFGAKRHELRAAGQQFPTF